MRKEQAERGKLKACAQDAPGAPQYSTLSACCITTPPSPIHRSCLSHLASGSSAPPSVPVPAPALPPSFCLCGAGPREHCNPMVFVSVTCVLVRSVDCPFVLTPDHGRLTNVSTLGASENGNEVRWESDRIFRNLLLLRSKTLSPHRRPAMLQYGIRTPLSWHIQCARGLTQLAASSQCSPTVVSTVPLPHTNRARAPT